MLSRRVVLLLAVAAAVSVANLYYCQPLLELMGRAVNAPASAMGALAMLGQAGYGVGMMLIVPLGDMLERKRLIVSLCVLVAGFLALMGLAPTLPLMMAASFAIGVTTCAPQLILPYAATLATPQTRGRIVGTITSGLLIGILLSRTVSGLVGEHAGYRAVYLGAAGLMLALALLLFVSLAPQRPAKPLRYIELIESIWRLSRTQPVLRHHTLLGALTFAGFGAFWTTLSFHLATPPLHSGGDIAGLYGLIGVAGALVAPLVGRLADQGNRGRTNLISICICAAAFALFALLGNSLMGIALGVLLLDIGVQGNHVTNQALLYSLEASLHSRLNALYMTGYFIGGAAGSALATAAFVRAGWLGVCAVGFGLSIAALIVYLNPPR